MSIKSDLADFVAIAEEEVGYEEGPNNDNKYGKAFGDNNRSWCGWFIAWCAKKAGISTTASSDSCPKIPELGYVPDIHKWYKRSNRSLIPNVSNTSSANYPKVGDLVIVDTAGGTTGTNHIGIVAAMNGSTVTVIEGNSSDAVEKNEYKNLVFSGQRISYLCSNNVSY